MGAADLVRGIRIRSGLTQRELAARSGTSPAAICQYEKGQRVPRVDTLERITLAAGAVLHLQLEWRRTPNVDLERNARVFEDLLDLADHLPRKRAERLSFPSMAQLAC